MTAKAGTSGLEKLPRGIRKYIRDVKQQTGRKITRKQIAKLKTGLRTSKYSILSKADADNNRVEFDQVKNRLIAEWEKETGQTWPRYTENLKAKDGKTLARRKGAAYDAHHVIENELGGPAEWWNIHPAKYPNEHQGGIHRSGSPLRILLKNLK